MAQRGGYKGEFIFPSSPKKESSKRRSTPKQMNETSAATTHSPQLRTFKNFLEKSKILPGSQTPTTENFH
jgi:hypothetical protein